MKMWLALGLAAVEIWLVAAPALAQQKKEIKPGVYMETLKAGDNIDASIGRGRKLFNDLGCAGCHPRGGTIG
ncbi:MAG: hypothetical protein ACREK6_15590, partial [Candidatus Rokuibacteriota bacterium]